jgi:hypothetical protein
VPITAAESNSVSPNDLFGLDLNILFGLDLNIFRRHCGRQGTRFSSSTKRSDTTTSLMLPPRVALEMGKVPVPKELKIYILSA